MSMTLTPILPGQRFRQSDGHDQEQVVTVARLDYDAAGLSRVVFRVPGGREICAYPTQVEAAIACGELAPAEDWHAADLVTIQAGEKLAS